MLLTTNVGTDLIMNLCQDPELMPDSDGLAKALRKPMLEAFPAALLGRIVTIPYYPLTDAVMRDIVQLQLGRIEQRIHENHKIPFTYDMDVINHIVSRCTEYESGGRMIDSILTNTVLPKVSQEILTCMMEAKPIERVHLSMADGEFKYTFE